MLTGVFAGILTLIYMVLAARIIQLRSRNNISLGDGWVDTLQRTIRAHGNLGEYMPIFLILLGILELQKVSTIAIWVLWAIFVVGRLVHIRWMLRVGRGFPFREVGMGITFTVLSIGATWNLYAYLVKTGL